MMTKVWKYQLGLEIEQTIRMPVGSTIVHCGVQNGEPCLWAQANPFADMEDRTFYIYGAGHEIEPGRKHVGTVQVGVFVWHVFQ